MPPPAAATGLDREARGPRGPRPVLAFTPRWRPGTLPRWEERASSWRTGSHRGPPVRRRRASDADRTDRGTSGDRCVVAHLEGSRPRGEELLERPTVIPPLQEESVLGVRAVHGMPQHHQELRGRQDRRDPRRALRAVEVLGRDLADRPVTVRSLRRREEAFVPLEPSIKWRSKNRTSFRRVGR
jgi:hypothetical protein